MACDVADLIPLTDLPDGFTYPPGFIRVVELGLTNLEPWWIAQGERLLERFAGMSQRYPARPLIPFALRQDNDDVACWDVDRGGVVIVHDFASPGWEQRAELPDFYTWLRQAIEDLIAFE
jgi:hypothetical protein